MGPLRKQFTNNVYKMSADDLDDRTCRVLAFQKISIIGKRNMIDGNTAY